MNLKYIFAKISYILNKFGRIINYVDKINAGHKRHLLQIEMQQSTMRKYTDHQQIDGPEEKTHSKLNPGIKRIIAQ